MKEVTLRQTAKWSIFVKYVHIPGCINMSRNGNLSQEMNNVYHRMIVRMVHNRCVIWLEERFEQKDKKIQLFK